MNRVMISVMAVVGLSLVVAPAHPTSALTYQNETDVEFTINPTISVSLSSSDIKIEDLAPGSSKDSNIVTVSVSTNAGYGYYLSATAGTKTTNTDLTNTADSTYKFNNLSSNVASLTNIPDNNWGYSYSTDNGTTWVSGNAESTSTGYNGLPLDNNDEGATGIKLISSNAYAASGSVRFKIGAKASSTQPAGTYANVVNFYAVANPAPDNTMQGFAAGAASTTCTAMSIGDTITLTDSRDDQAYTIGKLADGKCWMLENLNLSGGTALGADKTDVTSAYISSFITSNNLTKSGNTIVLPGSSISGFDNANYSYVYNSGNKTNCGAEGQEAPCYSYYSWDAATLGSGRTISTSDTDAEQSICPKGWKLPTSRTIDDADWQSGDFYAMAHKYGLDSTASTYEPDADFYNQAGPGTTPNFLLAGYYYYGSFNNGGSYGLYWSSTSGFNTYGASALRFSLSDVSSDDSNDRDVGFSVRCLFSGQ